MSQPLNREAYSQEVENLRAERAHEAYCMDMESQEYARLNAEADANEAAFDAYIEAQELAFAEFADDVEDDSF